MQNYHDFCQVVKIYWYPFNTPGWRGLGWSLCLAHEHYTVDRFMAEPGLLDSECSILMLVTSPLRLPQVYHRTKSYRLNDNYANCLLRMGTMD